MKRLSFLLLLIFSLCSCKSYMKEYSIIMIQYTDKVSAFNKTYQGIIDGLADKGYEKGVNLKIYYFCMESQNKSVEPFSIQKITKIKKDLIVTLGTIPTKLILKSLQSQNPIPLIFTTVLEPKALELDKNNRRLLNVTGMSMKIPVKTQLYLLKDAFPCLKKIGIFYCLDFPQCVYMTKEMEKKAYGFGLEIREVAFSNTVSFEELEVLCKNLAKSIDIIYLNDPLSHTPSFLKRIIKVADMYKVPVVGISDSCINFGALMNIYPDFYELGYKTSDIIDMVLKGTPPYSIPVQYPKEFRVGVNLRKAKELNIHIPRNFLLKSDLIVY